MKINTVPITSNQELLNAISDIQHSPIIAFDTEFLREKTYWPHLCLVQIATHKQAFIVDTLAPSINLEPLFSLLLQPHITKIVHAGIQDAEAIYAHTNQVISNVADTQLMARFCSTEHQIGLAPLLKNFSNVELEKEERLCDWSYRPLSPKQCSYALNDVIHLPALFDKLQQMISSLQRNELLQQEIVHVYSDKNFSQKIQTASQKIKAKNLPHSKSHILHALAVWRETNAIQKNIPRQKIISDNLLISLAHTAPQKLYDLKKVRILPNNFEKSRYAQTVINVIREAASQTPSPKSPKSLPQPYSEDALSLLSSLLKYTATQHRIAPQAIASASELRAIAANPRNAHAVLLGWKWELFGNNAQQLLNGKLAITLKNQKLHVLESKKL